MFRALKRFFAFICHVLSIQAVVVTASSDVDQASVTVPGVKLPYTIISPAPVLKRSVSQASAVSANLRRCVSDG